MSITKKFQSDKKNYKVTFSLPVDVAPNAKSVQVIGEFNNWDMRTAPAMKASKNEYSATLELNSGTYQFRYLIDGLRWENDFAADNYVSSPFAGINNSVLILPASVAAGGEKRGRKPAAEKVVASVKATAKTGSKSSIEKTAVPEKTSGGKRGRKPKAESASVAAPVAKAPAKRGRKPKSEGATSAPKPASTGKRGRPKKSA